MVNAGGNGERTWRLLGQTFTSYREYLEARDLRKREALRALGATDEDLGPALTVPVGATPENYNPERVWPIADSIGEALDTLYKLVSAADLVGQPAPSSLIPGILEAGRLGGIYGPHQTLKTSLAVDLAISLASGTPFLGRFRVPEPRRILFFSGESGLSALSSIAGRICRQRGLGLETLENFQVSDSLPRLDRPIHLMALSELIEREKLALVVIDSVYLSIRTDEPRKLPAMAAMLLELEEVCRKTSCAILVVHHTKKIKKVGPPLTFDELGSGFAEFSEQWLTASRRRAYNPDTGHHELWLCGGGRGGHRGLWALDVEEGALSPLADEGPIDLPKDEERTWKTTLRSFTWALDQEEDRCAAASESRLLRRQAIASQRWYRRTLEYLAAHPGGANASAIRAELGINGQRMAQILDSLVGQGRVIKTEFPGNRRLIVIYTLANRKESASTAQAGGVESSETAADKIRSGHCDEEASGPQGPAAEKPPVAGAAEESPPEKSGPDTGKSGPDSGPDTWKSGPDTSKSGPETSEFGS